MIWLIFLFLQPQYFIKYKGYPDSENTWEPPENLNCPRAIRNFERKLEKTANGENQVRVYYEFEKIVAKRTIDGNKVSHLAGIFFPIMLTMFFSICFVFCLAFFFGSFSTESAKTVFVFFFSVW